MLNRERFDMPAYDVMQEDASAEVVAKPVHSRPHQQVSKLLVHTPSDPGAHLKPPAADTLFVL